jgi:DNA-directed RNA polymerase specialized sigma24 family protein
VLRGGSPESEAFERRDFERFPASEASLMRIVHAALVSLPVEQKKLLLLRDQMALGYAAIASATGIPAADVRNRTLEARRQLRKKVEEGVTRAR